MTDIRRHRRRFDALEPGELTDDIRDHEGFGGRFPPSGTTRRIIHCRHGGRSNRGTPCGAVTVSAKQARGGAGAPHAPIRERRGRVAPASAVPSFNSLATEMFRRYARHWKPTRKESDCSQFRDHIVPCLWTIPIESITSRDVYLRFASLHGNPFAAGLPAPILSAILREAELSGYCPA